MRRLAYLALIASSAVAGLAGWLAGSEHGLQTAVRLAGTATGGQLHIEQASGRLLGPLDIQGGIDKARHPLVEGGAMIEVQHHLALPRWVALAATGSPVSQGRSSSRSAKGRSSKPIQFLCSKCRSLI